MFVFPSHTAHDGAHLSWVWLNTCLPMQRARFLILFCLCGSFSFTCIKLFLTSTLLIVSPFPLWESEQQLHGAELLVEVKPQRHTGMKCGPRFAVDS